MSKCFLTCGCYVYMLPLYIPSSTPSSPVKCSVTSPRSALPNYQLPRLWWHSGVAIHRRQHCQHAGQTPTSTAISSTLKSVDSMAVVNSQAPVGDHIMDWNFRWSYRMGEDIMSVVAALPSGPHARGMCLMASGYGGPESSGDWWIQLLALHKEILW